ncbi:hypothetical protein TNCV_382311 [Trichonephila clavipes]|nr:hypothetical protein TNCV_382311 [Trichonephila clavipes]
MTCPMSWENYLGPVQHVMGPVQHVMGPVQHVMGPVQHDLPDYFGGDDVQSPRGSTGTEGVGRYLGHFKRFNPNKYTATKERLLKIFVEMRKHKKMKRLFTGIELGDMLKVNC